MNHEQRFVLPTAIAPGSAAGSGPGPVVYVTGAGGQLVPVRADLLPGVSAAPRVAPVAVRDPWPARMAGGGVLALGVGVGGSMLFSAIAAAATGIGLLAACLALGLLLRGGGGGSGRVRVDVRVDNSSRFRAGR